MKGKILFREEQTFVGTWMWYLVIVITLSTVGFMSSLLAQSKSGTESVIGLVITIVLTGSVLALFTFSKLILTIDSSNIYYRFPPFINKERIVTKHEVKNIKMRIYRPILDYGGYGYRISFKNEKVLNISGNIGLQLILKGDNQLLIGTQKPDDLKIAINQLQLNWNNSEGDA